MYISYDTIFFSFDLRHFSLFFFFPIRTPTVTCTGHWIQLQRETWSKHGSNFFITPCEIWREWWVKKKRNQDWCHEVTTVMKETCMYIRHKETKNATTVKQQQQKKKKKKRKWGAAEQYTTKKGEKKVCAMTCEIQKYVCRTQREMWESTISRASGDQENTRRKKKRKKKESKRTNKTHKRIRKEQRERSGASRESEKKIKVRKQHVRLGEPRDKVKQSGKVTRRIMMP